MIDSSQVSGQVLAALQPLALSSSHGGKYLTVAATADSSAAGSAGLQTISLAQLSSVVSSADGICSASPPTSTAEAHVFSAGSAVEASEVEGSPPHLASKHVYDSEGGGVGAVSQYTPCHVCGDRSSGRHYGVTSCEGLVVTFHVF